MAVTVVDDDDELTEAEADLATWRELLAATEGWDAVDPEARRAFVKVGEEERGATANADAVLDAARKVLDDVWKEGE